MEEFGQFRPVDAPPMRHARLHRALAWLVSLSALGLVLSVPVYLFTNKEAEAVAAPAPVEATVPAVRAADIRRFATPQRLPLNSEVALVFDAREGEVIYEQRADRHRPIASLTKLMTAMVVLDARQRLDEVILIDDADRDRLRGSRSKLAVGNAYTRHDLLASALIASDNRAAAALARTYPGGTPAFIEAMNAKARTLGMAETRFADASGLDSRNISTARDLVRMALAASDYPNIRRLSTYDSYQLTDLRGGRTLTFPNANRLARRAGISMWARPVTPRTPATACWCKPKWASARSSSCCSIPGAARANTATPPVFATGCCARNANSRHSPPHPPIRAADARRAFASAAASSASPPPASPQS